jgi:predicted DNA-binding protein (MmcQ/YjbR family)
MAEIDWVRRFCLALAGATEQVQWGADLVFKVGGKMFAVMPLEPGGPGREDWPWLSLKCTPEEFAELTERPGVRPAAYLARAKWISLESEQTLGRAEAERLLRKSYELVVAKLPKRLREKIAKGGSAKASNRKKKRKRWRANRTAETRARGRNQRGAKSRSELKLRPPERHGERGSFGHVTG